MTQIELKTMNIICTSFPKVAEELKRIADALERKENGNDKTTAD